MERNISKKRLEEIVNFVYLVSDLICYKNDSTPKKIKKLHKKVCNNGVDCLLKEGSELEDD